MSFASQIYSLTNLAPWGTLELQARQRSGNGMQAKTYKNKALSALFLMNNVHYMVKTVESSPSLAVIGEDWTEQHKDQVGKLCVSVSVALCASVRVCQRPLPCCMVIIVSYNGHDVVMYGCIMVISCSLQDCASRALALKPRSHQP